MGNLVCFPQKGAGTKLTVKFPDVPIVRMLIIVLLRALSCFYSQILPHIARVSPFTLLHNFFCFFYIYRYGEKHTGVLFKR